MIFQQIESLVFISFWSIYCKTLSYTFWISSMREPISCFDSESSFFPSHNEMINRFWWEVFIVWRWVEWWRWWWQCWRSWRGKHWITGGHRMAVILHEIQFRFCQREHIQQRIILKEERFLSRFLKFFTILLPFCLDYFESELIWMSLSMSCQVYLRVKSFLELC